VDQSAGWVVRMWQKLWRTDKTTRILVFIGIAMVINVSLEFIARCRVLDAMRFR
jgi:hypothetical protein